VFVDLFAALFWAIACGVMAAGSAIVANDPNDEACPTYTYTYTYDSLSCTPVTSSPQWCAGVAAAAVAAIEW
jgi:hypothetical protein